MSVNFKLRDYEEGDIPSLLSVIKRAFKEHRGKLNPPSSAESKTVEIVREELTKANAIVVDIDHEVAGCVFYQPMDESVYIDRLSVLPEYRNRGIALALLTLVEKRARDQRFKTLTLSVRLPLIQQQTYYRKLGFECEKLDAHEGFTGPTFMEMKKVL